MRSLLMVALATTMLSTGVNASVQLPGEGQVCSDLHVSENVYFPTELSDHTKCVLASVYPDKKSGVNNLMAWIQLGGEYYSVPLKDLQQAGSKKKAQELFRNRITAQVLADNVADLVLDLSDAKEVAFDMIIDGGSDAELRLARANIDLVEGQLEVANGGSADINALVQDAIARANEVALDNFLAEINAVVPGDDLTSIADVLAAIDSGITYSADAQEIFNSIAANFDDEFADGLTPPTTSRGLIDWIDSVLLRVGGVVSAAPEFTFTTPAGHMISGQDIVTHFERELRDIQTRASDSANIVGNVIQGLNAAGVNVILDDTTTVAEIESAIRSVIGSGTAAMLDADQIALAVNTTAGNLVSAVATGGSTTTVPANFSGLANGNYSLAVTGGPGAVTHIEVSVHNGVVAAIPQTENTGVVSEVHDLSTNSVAWSDVLAGRNEGIAAIISTAGYGSFVPSSTMITPNNDYTLTFNDEAAGALNQFTFNAARDVVEMAPRAAIGDRFTYTDSEGRTVIGAIADNAAGFQRYTVGFHGLATEEAAWSTLEARWTGTAAGEFAQSVPLAPRSSAVTIDISTGTGNSWGDRIESAYNIVAALSDVTNTIPAHLEYTGTVPANGVEVHTLDDGNYQWNDPIDAVTEERRVATNVRYSDLGSGGSVAIVTDASGTERRYTSYDGREAALASAEIGGHVTFETRTVEISAAVPGQYTLNGDSLTGVVDIRNSVAFETIINEAITEAYNDGYDDGYGDGYKDGYKDGYVDGFDDGVESIR